MSLKTYLFVARSLPACILLGAGFERIRLLDGGAISVFLECS